MFNYEWAILNQAEKQFVELDQKIRLEQAKYVYNVIFRSIRVNILLKNNMYYLL